MGRRWTILYSMIALIVFVGFSRQAFAQMSENEWMIMNQRIEEMNRQQAEMERSMRETLKQQKRTEEIQNCERESELSRNGLPMNSEYLAKQNLEKSEDQRDRRNRKSP